MPHSSGHATDLEIFPSYPNCVFCRCYMSKYDKEVVQEEHSHLFEQADALGMESLTENEQILVNGGVHDGCYKHL